MLRCRNACLDRDGKGESNVKLVCILFAELYDDADIIAVPDRLYVNIQELGQQFCRWLEKGEHDFWVTSPNGKRYLNLETDGFVWWLNKPLGDDSNEKVKIVEQHVRYRPELKTVVF